MLLYIPMALSFAGLVAQLMAGEVPAENYMVNDASNGLSDAGDILESEKWKAKLAAIKEQATATAAARL